MFIISILVLSTIVLILLTVRTAQVLRRYRMPSFGQLVHNPAPTVSVCIAARNETHALAQCLERILKNDYKKLEILVLDDSSSDSTSLIIRSFATAGVRFIAGKSLPDGWLGKNHAYQTLIDEASGDILMFMDVDTFIRPSTISQLVALQQSAGVKMLSVLPRREDVRVSSIFGTMRYYWELLLTADSKPPAASAIWAADADVFDQSSMSFRNYSMSVRPERHLARQLNDQGTYRYVIAEPSLGITYEKQLHSQYETALRLYYPLLERNPFVLILCIIALLALIAPIIVLLCFQWNQTTFIWSLSLLVLLLVPFRMFERRVYGPNILSMRPSQILLVQELVLLLRSFIGYKTGTITWKGRRVTEQNNKAESIEVNE